MIRNIQLLAGLPAYGPSATAYPERWGRNGRDGKNVFFIGLIPTLLLLSGCVHVETWCVPGMPPWQYWPDPADDSGVYVNICNIETAVDENGRKWLAPRDGSKFIYRNDGAQNEVMRYELDAEASDIVAGAGFVWVLPSLHFTAIYDEIYRIDPVTGTISARISFPEPYRVFDLIPVRDFVWAVGDLKETFEKDSAITQIDAKAGRVVALYEHPNPVPLDSDELKTYFDVQPQPILINEQKYILLHALEKGAEYPDFRTLKLDLRTRKYSEVKEPLEVDDWCPNGSEEIRTKLIVRLFVCF